MQSPRFSVLITGCLTSLCWLWPSLALVALADDPIPQGVGNQSNTASGGARRGGGCLVPGAGDPKNLMPLIPVVADAAPASAKTTLTVAEHPTFFFFVPQVQTQTAAFVLVNDRNQPLYRTTLSLPLDPQNPLRSRPGVIALTLPPESTPGLQPNTSYRWSLSLLCDPTDASDNPSIKGIIQRVTDPALAAKVRQAKPRDIPALYAQAGIWQETLATLYQLRQADPKNASLVLQWQGILQSVGLNNLADEPIVQTCPSATCVLESLPIAQDNRNNLEPSPNAPPARGDNALDTSVIRRPGVDVPSSPTILPTRGALIDDGDVIRRPSIGPGSRSGAGSR